MPNDKPKTNIYDRIFRENARKIFIALVEQVYQLDIKNFEVLDPKFPSTSENEVDFLYEITLDDGKKQILHIEFQSANDSNMLARMQEYHAKIYKKYKLPVRPIVINLSQKTFTASTKLKDNEVFYGYDTIELFSLSTDMLLSSQIPEVVILAILSNYPKDRLEAVLKAIVIKLKQLVIAEKDMNRFINQLFYLSRLRKFEKETKEKLEEMLIVIDIKQDYYYKEGEKQGIVIGKEEGKKEGKEEGIGLTLEILRLHNKGVSPEIIAKNLSIDIEKINSIISKFLGV